MDIRPHIFDPVLKQFLLCDSGSMVSAFPPDLGDLPVRNQFLKAVNGSRMACYGYKGHLDQNWLEAISFQNQQGSGWKSYNRLGFYEASQAGSQRNDSDQITIYDKTSKVSSVLHLKPIPIDQSLLMKNFSLVKSEPEHPGGQGLENPEVLLNEVSTRAARFLGGFTSHHFLGSLGYVWVTLRRIWPRVVVFRIGESVL